MPPRTPSPLAAAVLRAALADPGTVRRYLAKVRIDDPAGCWWWTGAIAGKGHGRFWLAAADGRDIAVIAHRYGYGLARGHDALAAAEVLAHACDNPLCQNPDHLAATTNRDNRQQWADRRRTPGNPARDLRGTRGRARQLRDAAAAGHDLTTTADAGLPPVDRDQLPLF